MTDRRLVLDAGAFIAYERFDARTRAVIEGAHRTGTSVTTSSAVVAQVWTGSARQARLARLLASGLVDERPLDRDAGRAVGALRAATGSDDVVDGHVALLAEHPRAIVVTSDGDDLVRLGVPEQRVLRI